MYFQHVGSCEFRNAYISKFKREVKSYIGLPPMLNNLFYSSKTITSFKKYKFNTSYGRWKLSYCILLSTDLNFFFPFYSF